MIQIYFLSIFLNVLAGYVLVIGGEGEKADSEAKFRFSINNETFRLILGALTVVTGLLKLLSPVQGDVPVAGDLFSVLAGLAAGLILIFDFYRSRSSLVPERLEKAGNFLSKGRKGIGFAVIAAAVLHFMFPAVPLL
jgi:cytochrome c biogenesis protein CcdA